MWLPPIFSLQQLGKGLTSKEKVRAHKCSHCGCSSPRECKSQQLAELWQVAGDGWDTASSEPTPAGQRGAWMGKRLLEQGKQQPGTF